MKKYANQYFKLYHKSSPLKKAFFWGGISLVLLVLLIFIAGIILQGLLPARIKKAISERSHHVYKISFDDMQLSIFRGSILLNDMELVPDTSAYFRLDSLNRPSSLFQIKADHIGISGVDIVKLVFSKKPDIGHIGILNPGIVLMDMGGKKRKKEGSLYEQLPPVLKGARIGRIDVKTLSFQKTHYREPSKNSGRLTGLTFQVTDLFLDSARTRDSLYTWFAQDIRLASKNLSYFSADSLYEFKVKAIRGSTKDKVMKIDSFRVIPQYPEMEFSRRLGKQGDRYQMVFGRIAAFDIHFKQLELESRLFFRSLVLQGNSIKVFRNKAIPEIKIDKTLNFPHVAFKRLKLPLTSDTVMIKDTRVSYKEFNPKSGKAGTVFFTDLNGTLLNVSNDSIRWKKDHWCRSTFTANFLGKPRLELILNLDLSDKEASFNYKGTLGQAPAQLYNQLFEPLALAKADSGTIHKTTFDVKANRYGSNAAVSMRYSNLKISILGKTTDKGDVDEKDKKTAVGRFITGIFGSGKESDEDTLERKDMVSLLANIVIETDNPSKGEEVRTAVIDYQHPRDKSFFNLMWKSIFTGLKGNVGVPL